MTHSLGMQCFATQLQPQVGCPTNEAAPVKAIQPFIKRVAEGQLLEQVPQCSTYVGLCCMFVMFQKHSTVLTNEAAPVEAVQPFSQRVAEGQPQHGLQRRQRQRCGELQDDLLVVAAAVRADGACRKDGR